MFVFFLSAFIKKKKKFIKINLKKRKKELGLHTDVNVHAEGTYC